MQKEEGMVRGRRLFPSFSGIRPAPFETAYHEKQQTFYQSIAMTKRMIKNASYEGERPLFASRHLRLRRHYLSGGIRPEGML